jgi:ABC-type transport system substrate-binding protein
MVEYKYNIYTGGVSFGIDPPDLLYSQFHSSQYWAPLGWSGNYAGFSDTTTDGYLYDVKFGSDYNKVIQGVHNATYLLNKYVSSIPLWSSSSSMAYRTGWTGVVNHAGYGITWGTGGVYYWSFLNMRKSGTDTINMGFKSNPEELNVITAEWVWDYIVLDAIYDGLIVRNPYNLADHKGMLATDWSTGTWGGNKVYVDFTLKSGVKFHNGKTLTAEDVAWGREFMRDCGPGVAWGYPTLKNIYNATVLVGGEGGKVRLYMKTGSYWALHDAGFIEVLNPDIWKAAGQALHWGYNEVTHTFDGPGKDNVYGTEDDGANSVRLYLPYKDDYYPGGTGDGIKDLSQDGTGPWVFLSVTGVWEYIDLAAFRPGIPETPWQVNQYHMSQSEVEDYLNTAFHKVGNVNYPGSAHETDYNNAGMGIDRSIDVVPDILLIERAAGTNSLGTAGIDWNKWNVDADLNGDNKVTGADYGIANFNLLATAG